MSNASLVKQSRIEWAEDILTRVVDAYKHVAASGRPAWYYEAATFLCDHGMSAHGPNGCVDCDCTTPGFRGRE